MAPKGRERTMTDRRTLDGRVDVSVVEDDEGRIAASFERYFLESARGHAVQQLGDGRAAREGHLLDCGVLAHLPPDLGHVSLCGHDVDDSGRHASAGRELHKTTVVSLAQCGRSAIISHSQLWLETYFDESKGGERGLGRWLDDGGAAGCKSGAELPGDHRGREVPWCQD